MTTVVFWILDPAASSLSIWRTPLFLFTILVAVGEDYNIFLMSRIRDEQRRLGPLAGITRGLSKTGSIISSCGIIMAGTFASLMAGSLSELRQMGFALAFGVLLDTLVVRPLLVPSFLVLYESFLARVVSPSSDRALRCLMRREFNPDSGRTALARGEPNGTPSANLIPLRLLRSPVGM